MESVEELCDNIALINKSKVVISGGVEEIRRKYGNNNVELIYTGAGSIGSVPGKFAVLSDVDESGRHTAVLALDNDCDTNSAIKEIMALGYKISSFKELVPRMNDIFIKLVTEGE
jgi:ABC-2 type transport system ATP-binding protein